jgi:hypothetical protein
MRYSDVKHDCILRFDPDEVTDQMFHAGLLRILHAIAGELDSISYRLRKSRKKGVRRAKQVRA